MRRIQSIELKKENMKFAAGHFTIFSSTERENLHGHNYQVQLNLQVNVGANGMSFDYRIYKRKILKLCKQLNESFLLPTLSPYLKIEEDELYYYALFAQEKIPFLKRDVRLLDLTNITLEELSRWFIEQLSKDKTELIEQGVSEISVRIFSAPGQCASCTRTIDVN